MKELKNSDLSITIIWQLFLVFLVLKLVGVIDWSWLYITLPLTAPLVLVVVLLIWVYIKAKIVWRRLESKKSE